MDNKKFTTIALCLALLAAVATWLYLNSLERKYSEDSNPVPVLTARGYIPKGTILKERMVQIAKVPKQYLQPGAFRAIAEILDEKGRSCFVTLLPVLENEQVCMSKLSSIKEEIGLAVTVPDGKTAVPVPANEFTLLGGLLRPGNRVNVLCTFDMGGGKGGGGYSETMTLLQNALVLSVGNEMIGNTLQVKETNANGQPDDSKKQVITLALTPEESALLTFARERGSITLALRPSYDDTVRDIAPVKIENVSAHRNIAAGLTSGELKPEELLRQLGK